MLLKEPAARAWNPIWRAGTTQLLSVILIQIHGRINQQRLKCPRAGMNVTSAEATSKGMNSALCARVAEIQFIFFWVIHKTERKSIYVHVRMDAEGIPPFQLRTDPLRDWTQMLQLAHTGICRIVCLVSSWRQTSSLPRCCFSVSLCALHRDSGVLS